MKNFLHIAFLMTAIVLKVASTPIHLYVEHGEDETTGEKCELCEHAIHNQELDADIPEDYASIEAFYTYYAEPINLYRSIARQLAIDTSRFGRPPPSLV